ncbi:MULTISPECIES: phospholipase D-like domain-containing protein [Thermomonosporaceae]|uniref:phospholipase D-like domain-containing protein n=1 Tax=Thermomonosporaceae TaxID=2012 RepID=UPI00255ACCF1|nr:MULTISPECIES: phospholipase D-like domain-containing protein [Thermomonosporaceae]MDL4776213.1 phospholipase D-like domain-containing protein [Actinomadura xylanilytica]
MRRFAIASGGLIIVTALVAVDATTASAASGTGAGTRAALVNAPAAAPQGRSTPLKPKPLKSKATKRKAAKAKRYYVTQGPRFNLPTGNLKQQGAVDLYIKKLIRHSPKGSEIDVSLFRLQTEGMAKELVRAQKRKVKVRVIVDSDSLGRRKGVYDYLRRHLGANPRRSSWILVCPKGRGCIAPKAKGEWSKNHNKFYAFSRTYDSRNVVVQTSGNATGGMYNQYNDAYTLADAKLYKAYRTYFYDLQKRRANGNYYRTYRSGARAASYFPKAKGDPIADALDKVSCAGGTSIRLSSGMFTRTGVSTRLAGLDDAGCDVKIVSGTLGDSTAKVLSRSGPHGGPDVHVFTAQQSQRAHSKYLLIDGRYQGRDRKLVITGSHSYTTDALRHNDEAIVTLEQGSVHDAYARNFARVFGAAKGRLMIAPWSPTKTVPDNATDPEDEGTPPSDGPGAGNPESGAAGAGAPELQLPADDGAGAPPAAGPPSTDG